MATCSDTVQKTNVVITGFSKAESAEAICNAYRYNKAADRPLTSALLGEITRSVLSDKFGDLNKSVLGGMQHVVSVDNAAGYAELWYKGGSWYAVTDAALSKALTGKATEMIWEVPGIVKGMKLDEASVRFMEAVFGPANVQKGCGCSG